MRWIADRLARVGLRWRLAAWVAAVILVCTGITFVAVYRGTGTQLRRQIDSEISGDTNELAHNLKGNDVRTPGQVAETAGRYVRDQPFGDSSTLLFVQVPGAATSTNRPELFSHTAPDNGETPAQQVRENQVSQALLTVP